MGGKQGFSRFNVFNVTSEEMMRAVRRQLAVGEGVWFTALVGPQNPYMVQDGDEVPPQARNAMHLASFDYDNVARIPRPSKQARFDARMSWSVHAMTFVGADFPKSRPSRTLKLEADNSWLARQHIYADWFHEFVDTIVVRLDVLPLKLRRAIEGAQATALPFPQQ
jgi:aminopeptidase C